MNNGIGEKEIKFYIRKDIDTAGELSILTCLKKAFADSGLSLEKLFTVDFIEWCSAQMIDGTHPDIMEHQNKLINEFFNERKQRGFAETENKELKDKLIEANILLTESTNLIQSLQAELNKVCEVKDNILNLIGKAGL